MLNTQRIYVSFLLYYNIYTIAIIIIQYNSCVPKGLIDPMYQFSLRYFTQLFNLTIENSPQSKDLTKRLEIVADVVFESFNAFTSSSLSRILPSDSNNIYYSEKLEIINFTAAKKITWSQFNKQKIIHYSPYYKINMYYFTYAYIKKFVVLFHYF